MTFISAVLLLAASVAGAGASSRAATGKPVFVLTGGGWGHGVGMSQWGALGLAQAGRSSTQILETYYRGTTLGTTTAKRVRVLVTPAAKTLRVGSAVPFRVRDAVGTVIELPAGELKLGPGLKVKVDAEPVALTSPVLFKPGLGSPVTVAGKGYRGEVRVTSDGSALQAVNVVALESYLLGVVPGEMPKEWPLEALKAQAVAARSYAVASLAKDRPYDLHSDQRSQVYYGAGSEAPGPTRAVKETRGQILLYGGTPALTLYFSSSGGRTRSGLDVFGLDLPYLQPVDDPWDAVSTNPNHRWAPRTLTGKQLAAGLGLTSPVVDVVTVPGSDGRPLLVRFTSASGTTAEVGVRDVRTRLTLLSNSFRLGVLSLLPPDGPATAGAAVALAGVARDVEEPLLERKEADATWVRAKRIVPRPDGSFRVVVRPRTTSTYRLSGAGLPGPALTVKVDEAPA